MSIAMKIILMIAMLLETAFCNAQVNVRGYYRSNRTYVQPHQRTYPNSTITDNYSYPGNYNPNTGQITGGTSSYITSTNQYHRSREKGVKSRDYESPLNRIRKKISFQFSIPDGVKTIFLTLKKPVLLTPMNF